MNGIVGWLEGLPMLLVYLVLAAGAALENIVPPVPADTFVLFGAFLAGMGRANAWLVLGVTWGANVGSALATYGLARRYGQRFFDTRVGGWLLRPGQLERLRDFYRRWGVRAIFFSRFFPALRALVPVFAGVSHVSFPRVALPLAAASLLWYGGLVYLGAAAGRNWEAIASLFDQVNTGLLIAAALLVGALGVWWWRTRHPDGAARDES